MSLTYTSALCSDSKWYKNPTWRGELNNQMFFVCLDDEEPPELVVAETDTRIEMLLAKSKAEQIIEMLKFECVIHDNSFMKCGRNFGDRGKNILRKAFRFFIDVFERPKPPTHFDTVWECEPPDGVKYFSTIKVNYEEDAVSK